MEYIVEQFFSLAAIPSPSGYTRAAIEYTIGEFKKLGFDAARTGKGGILVDFGGEGNALIYASHLDTLGGIVAEIKSSGALRIAPVGGLNPNNIETENVTVRTRDGRSYSGVCQLENASTHVNLKYSDTKRDFNTVEILVDEKVYSKQETEALGIAIGDYVCFDPRTTYTESGFLKSRFLDDKLSVAILLAYAKELRETGAKLSRKVYGFISVFEEVGHGASASIPPDAVDFISVDMGCVGTGLSCRETQCSICVKDSAGPSNYELTGELIACAKAHGVDYALDVYPSYRSDADMALIAGHDLRHCAVGFGVYASHGYERTHMDGVRATLALLKGYTFMK